MRLPTPQWSRRLSRSSRSLMRLVAPTRSRLMDCLLVSARPNLLFSRGKEGGRETGPFTKASLDPSFKHLFFTYCTNTSIFFSIHTKLTFSDIAPPFFIASDVSGYFPKKIFLLGYEVNNRHVNKGGRNDDTVVYKDQRQRKKRKGTKQKQWVAIEVKPCQRSYSREGGRAQSCRDHTDRLTDLVEQHQEEDALLGGQVELVGVSAVSVLDHVDVALNRQARRSTFRCRWCPGRGP